MLDEFIEFGICFVIHNFHYIIKVMRLLIQLFGLILVLSACKVKQREIQNLIYLLEESSKNGLDRFLIVDRIVNIYIRNKNYEKALMIVNQGIANDE